MASNGDGVGDSDERNVISANPVVGVSIGPGGHNVVAGNYIGTDVTGIAGLGSQSAGVRISTSSFNRIGTNGDGVADDAERNDGGGRVLCGGEPISDTCYAPTVLFDPPAQARISVEEEWFASDPPGTLKTFLSEHGIPFLDLDSPGGRQAFERRRSGKERALVLWVREPVDPRRPSVPRRRMPEPEKAARILVFSHSQRLG